MDESSSVTSTTSSTSVTLTADTSPGGGGGSSSSSSPSSQMVSVRIYVPELNVQKVIHFHREELVWNVKQQCLATLPKVSFSFLFFPFFSYRLLFLELCACILLDVGILIFNWPPTVCERWDRDDTWHWSISECVSLSLSRVAVLLLLLYYKCRLFFPFIFMYYIQTNKKY